MGERLTRRQVTAFSGALLAGGVLLQPSFAQAATRVDDLDGTLTAIEARIRARLGVAVHDTETGRRWTHRSAERFPMCSTFKVLACGAVLARVDAKMDDLTRNVSFGTDDLVTYSPVTEKRAGGPGMTLGELCEAAMTQSDNTAGNLILQSIGGPAAVTAFAKRLGDPVTRLDRMETELNEAKPSDPRDTTTPDAMVANLHALVIGNVLSPASREQLMAWMMANKTGDAKLRAGLPKEWRMGDKTGGGDHGTMNDVAVILPPGRKPVFVSVYMTETETSFELRNVAIAEIGQAIATALGA